MNFVLRKHVLNKKQHSLEDERCVRGATSVRLTLIKNPFMKQRDKKPASLFRVQPDAIPFTLITVAIPARAI
jgi:hypothetical protein